MMNLTRFLSAAGATVLLAVLAGCNGKEDFSNVDLPGCPAGALCEETPSGDVLVEFVGPRLLNIGYRCGASLGRTYAEPTEVDGRMVPAGAAVCPENATSVEFFLGYGVYLGNVLPIGRAALPQQAILTTLGEDGTVWGVQRLSLADVLESPRRLPATDARIRNRAALLLALDSDTTTADIELPDVLHGAEGIINQRYNELVRGRSLEATDFVEFKDAWSPLLDAVGEEVGGNNAPYIFATESDVLARLTYSTELTRAGFYEVGYQESQAAILGLTGTDKQPAADRLGTLSGSMLVLPTGEVVGLASVLLSHVQGGNDPAETEQDMLSFSRDAHLDDELVLENVALQGLMNNDVTTDISVSGRFLGNALHHGVPGQNGVDYALMYPTMYYRPVADDFGRILGTFLGSPVADLLHKKPDPAPEGLPVRMARVELGATSLDPAALDAAVGFYQLTLRRGCTDAEIADDPASCELIEEKNERNYEGGYEIEAGTDTTEAVNFTFSQDTPRGGGLDNSGDATMFLEIRQVGGHGIVYAGRNGQCPTGDPQNDFPVGYISRTVVEEGVIESAGVMLMLSGQADEQGDLRHFGTEIQGRIALNDASNNRPIYRLSDEHFADQVAAQWIDTYMPQKYYQTQGVDSVDELSNEQKQRLLAHVRGSVGWEYVGASCPP